MTTPDYSLAADRVARLLDRLRNMHASINGSDNYNQGVRQGIQSAALAVKEELNTNLIETLSGPPKPQTPSGFALLADVDIEQLSEEMQYHEVSLSTVIEALHCEHEFEKTGLGPQGEDLYGTCFNCEISREFLETMGWPLGSVMCEFCSDDDSLCSECGKGCGQ